MTYKVSSGTLNLCSLTHSLWKFVLVCRHPAVAYVSRCWCEMYLNLCYRLLYLCQGVITVAQLAVLDREERSAITLSVAAYDNPNALPQQRLWDFSTVIILFCFCHHYTVGILSPVFQSHLTF